MHTSLKEGALFIADAHYPNRSETFLSLLESINSGQIKTPQLILMGDIFDLLVGNSSYLKEKFSNEIELLEEIAQKIETIYIEGNHDFYLKPLFKYVKTIPLQNQPLILNHNGKNFSLAHGDKFNTSLFYKIYTKTIRSPLVLKILPEITAKYMLKRMKNKKICKKIPNFEAIAEKIIKSHKAKNIIEAHFHQGRQIKTYTSLPSFACTKQYAVLKNGKVEFVKFEL